MKGHIRLVGILHIVMTILNVLVASAALALYAFGASALGLAVGQESAQGGGIVFGILAGLGLIGGVILLLPSLPGFLGGYGLLRSRPWARWLVAVVSVIYLFYFPLGTLLGAYSLWVLFHKNSGLVFEGGPS